MSNFKRGSRFSRGGSTGGSGRSEERSEGRSQGRGGYSGGGSSRGKPKFTRLGSMTVPKSASDELRDSILDELRGSEIKLNVKIYPPKGVDKVTLNRDDVLLITFGVNEKDREFVVGHLLLPNGEE